MFFTQVKISMAQCKCLGKILDYLETRGYKTIEGKPKQPIMNLLLILISLGYIVLTAGNAFATESPSLLFYFVNALTVFKLIIEVFKPVIGKNTTFFDKRIARTIITLTFWCGLLLLIRVLKSPIAINWFLLVSYTATATALINCYKTVLKLLEDTFTVSYEDKDQKKGESK